MINKSIWSSYKNKKIYSKLKKDIDVDILIIGGGITGISTLYHLKDSNLKVCLVEKNIIGSGVTSKTTGKLTYLQDNIYTKLKKYHNEKISHSYLKSQMDAINIVKDIINHENIDCNFKKVRSYVFTNNFDTNIEKEINLLEKFKITIYRSDILPDNSKVFKTYYVENTYIFHPLKYLYSLAEKSINKYQNIYENTNILSIERKNDNYICKTRENTIKAKKIIIATHYPYFLKKLFLPLKSYIEKSYIAAYKVNTYYNFSSINIDKPTISTRYYKSDDIYKIYLTNSHNTVIQNNEIDNFNDLINGKFVPDYIWSNKDIITIDSLPYIGSLDDKNTFLIATGYNTWGMTNGSLAGKILSDILFGWDNKYISLFNPKRGLNLGQIINFPLILVGNGCSFINSKIIKNKSWYSNKVQFKNINGENIAIYTDENNIEHKVYNICPHLKCSLLFNEIEKTWDCPCHGSKFDIDGNSIEGPSNYNITYKD